MAGGLAALFAAGRPAAVTADVTADAVSQPVTLVEILDALRATRDADTVLKGFTIVVLSGNPVHVLSTATLVCRSTEFAQLVEGCRRSGTAPGTVRVACGAERHLGRTGPGKYLGKAFAEPICNASHPHLLAADAS